MSLLLILAAVVIWGLVAIRYLLIPAILHQSYRVPAETKLGPIGRTELAAIDREAPATIEAKVAELLMLGFDRVTPFRTIEGQTTIFGALLEHPGHGDLASFVIGRTPGAPGAAFTLFESEWEDGYRVVTTDTTQTPIFPRARDLDGMALPTVTLLADLYRVHRARVERTSRPARRRHLTRGDDALAGERARQMAERRRHVEIGYLYRRGDIVQPTLRGAFLMSWRSLPPWKNLFVRQRDRREAALLRDLGFA